MRSRTLFALLLVVAGLGGFIWFYERALPSTEERAVLNKKLVKFDDGTVRALVLTAGAERVRLDFERPDESGSDESADSGTWWLTEPRRARADEGEVDEFLDRIRELEKQRELEDVSEQDVGLDRPRALIQLDTESGAIQLRIGSKVPASSSTIVALGEEPPFHVVSGDLTDDVARDPDGWRSRDAIPFDGSRMARLEILEPSNGVVLERRGEEVRLVRPIEDLADEARVSELVEALEDLEIEAFLGLESGAEFSSPPAALRLTVDGVEDPILVEVERTEGGDDEAVMIRVAGEPFEAQTDLASLLERRPSEWRSTAWSTVSAFEVDSFRIRRREGAEQAFELVDGTWMHAQGAEVNYAKASGFVRGVTDARGVALDFDPAGALAAPEIEIELETSERTEVLRIFSGRRGYTAERSDRAARLRLEDESADEFRRALEDLEAELVEEAPTESQ